MTQFELFEIDNPCIGVCQSDVKGLCLGCLRKREERQHWHQMSNEQKRIVMRLIIARDKKRQRQNQAIKTAQPDTTADTPQADVLLGLF